MFSSSVKDMEKRLAATEESLKLRVTQMEVAIMGALKSGMNGGGAARGDHRDGASPNCNRRGSNFATGNNNNLGLAADVLEENGSEQAVKGESSSHAYELYRTGQTVTQMQSLVEGDAEIRQLLLYLRRQVARAETRSAAYQLDDEGGQLQRSQRGFFMWPCCCCPEPDTPSGDRLRRTLRLLGPVLHPDARFRSIWYVSLAVLIVYCGVAIPFEIAFEDDMLYEMCSCLHLHPSLQQCAMNAHHGKYGSGSILWSICGLYAMSSLICGQGAFSHS